VKISVNNLKAKKACQDQLDLFTRTFGDKPVSVTKANCLKAAAAGLDFDWAANRLLSPAARTDYNKTVDAAWADYDKAIDAALADYDKACDAARADYVKACDAARADYVKAHALAFWRASRAQKRLITEKEERTQ